MHEKIMATTKAERTCTDYGWFSIAINPYTEC